MGGSSAFGRPLLGIAAVFLLGLAAAEPAAASDDGGERIRSYEVALTVAPDGSLQVAETIEYDYGADARHGIERRIDTEQPYDASHDRRFPVSEIEVSSPSAPAQVQVTESGGEVRLRIGDPDRTVTGQATYRISYLVAAATTRYADRDELYWNAVGPGWSVPVDRVTVRVTGAEVTGAACYSGPPGTRTPCASARASGSAAAYEGGPLGAGDALTVVATFPAGTVAAAAPVLTDRVTAGRFLAGTPAVALPVAGVLLVGLLPWWLGPLFRRRRSQPRVPPLPLGSQTEPPPGMRPALVGTVLQGSFKRVDQVAMLLDLAARNYLSITPVDSHEWQLTASGRSPDGDLRPEELALLGAVFGKEPATPLSKAGPRLARARWPIRREVYADVVAQGWFTDRPDRGRLRLAVAGGLLVVLAVPVTLLSGFLLHAGAIGLAVGLVGLVLAGCSLLEPPPRTAAGAAVRAQLVAYREHLAAIDPGRLPAEQRQAAFAGLLPYAVALSLAPQLGWALSAAGGDVHPIWRSTFVDDATSASATSFSSGGGGGSSGGSSGGGGGGGGGGSW